MRTEEGTPLLKKIGRWFRSDGLMNGILFICACGLGGIEIYRLFVRM